MKVEKSDDEYQSEVIRTKVNPIDCEHHFVRKGARVECEKCTVGYDDPKHDFPIEEANSS